MGYSKFEQETTDLDLYFRDSEKDVHIASGGGRIPEAINLLEQQIESFKDNWLIIEEEYEIEINPNLKELLNLSKDGYEFYIGDFEKNAKKGFYSYDKTNLGNLEDSTFHLVAKPKFRGGTEMRAIGLPQISSANLPSEFKVFNINDVLNVSKNE